jgi:hypothetical protein
MLAKGPSFEGFVTLGAGIGDLGSGFYNFLIPALEKTKLATLASAAASKVAALGTNLWTGAQKLLSLAFLSSPIGWIVLGIGALVAVVVLIATKTDWFQRLWKFAWSGIKSAASNAWEFIRKIPGWIGSAFSTIADAVSRPFKSGFNAVARAWNNTVGRLSWTVPGWVPVIGGNSISVPKLPTFHAGGTVPGIPGQAVPILAMAGETVSSNAGSAGGGSGGWIPIGSDGTALGDALVETIAAAVRTRFSGNVAALGVRLG